MAHLQSVSFVQAIMNEAQYSLSSRCNHESEVGDWSPESGVMTSASASFGLCSLSFSEAGELTAVGEEAVLLSAGTGTGTGDGTGTGTANSSGGARSADGVGGWIVTAGAPSRRACDLFWPIGFDGPSIVCRAPSRPAGDGDTNASFSTPSVSPVDVDLDDNSPGSSAIQSDTRFTLFVDVDEASRSVAATDSCWRPSGRAGALVFRDDAPPDARALCAKMSARCRGLSGVEKSCRRRIRLAFSELTGA